MATAVPILLFASTAIAAYGAIQQGQAAKDSANFNAQVATNSARVAELQAQAEESRHRRMARKSLGAIRAAYGASGVTIEGSPFDVLSESSVTAEADALNIRYGGALRSAGFRDTATLDRLQGRNAQRASRFNAASTVLSGTTSYLDYDLRRS